MGFALSTYDLSGDLNPNDPALLCGSVTTDSGGAFSVDISGTGLTRVHSVHAHCLDTASGVANTTIVSITSFNASTVTGNVYQFATGLGLTLAAVGSGRTVYLTITGDLS